MSFHVPAIPPCSLILVTLSHLSITCSRCKSTIALSNYTPYLQSSFKYVPVDVALKEILDHPVIELLTLVESALQLHLVKRSLLQSPTKDVLALKGDYFIPFSKNVLYV